MRISVCVGNYATTPYFIEGLDIPVYCMEELCYCMKENAFLLDTSLMNDALVDWIGEECGLRDLAEELYPLIHKQGSLSAYVGMILEYVGLYEPTVIRQVGQVLKQGAGLSNIEKRKSQIDYLVRKKKYVAALRGYDMLLAGWRRMESEAEELPAAGVKAAILHNKGVAYTGLMVYGQAAEAFLEAYRISNAREHFMAYLAAKRMELSEEDYIAFAAELSGNYEESLTLEKRLDELDRNWEQQPEYQRLAMRMQWKESGDRQRYYQENELLTTALRAGYRSSVME